MQGARARASANALLESPRGPAPGSIGRELCGLRGTADSKATIIQAQTGTSASRHTSLPGAARAAGARAPRSAAASQRRRSVAAPPTGYTGQAGAGSLACARCTGRAARAGAPAAAAAAAPRRPRAEPGGALRLAAPRAAARPRAPGQRPRRLQGRPRRSPAAAPLAPGGAAPARAPPLLVASGPAGEARPGVLGPRARARARAGPRGRQVHKCGGLLLTSTSCLLAVARVARRARCKVAASARCLVSEVWCWAPTGPVGSR